MIVVKIKRNHLSEIVAYTVSGHADYADYGQDIVCAAVSILAQNTLASLLEVCEIDEDHIDYRIQEDGYLDVKLSKEIKKDKYDRSQIVLKSFELGVKSIVEVYPKFVTLKYRRCER